MNRIKSSSLPIIHIIGLPGSGKTTLGKKISALYGLPVYYIGTYRARFPATVEGEADAWVALFRDLSRRKWANCILETTGLNSRERFLRDAFPFSRIVTIKLTAQRKVLHERIGRKKKTDRGRDWLFSDEYRDKYEFVRKMFKHFKDVPSESAIDTTKLTPREVFEKAAGKLVFWIL
jgi:thymidylate kinase